MGTDASVFHFCFICRFYLTWKTEMLNSKPTHFILGKILLFIWMQMNFSLPTFKSNGKLQYTNPQSSSSLLLWARVLREGRDSSLLGLQEVNGHNPTEESRGCIAMLCLPKFSNSFAISLWQKGCWAHITGFFLLSFPKKEKAPTKGRPFKFHAIPWPCMKVCGYGGRLDFLFCIQTDWGAEASALTA